MGGDLAIKADRAKRYTFLYLRRMKNLRPRALGYGMFLISLGNIRASRFLTLTFLNTAGNYRHLLESESLQEATILFDGSFRLNNTRIPTGS